MRTKIIATRLFAFSLFTVGLTSISASAQSLGQLIEKSTTITERLEFEGRNLSSNQKQQLNRILSNALAVFDGDFPDRPDRILHKGICEVDDDPNFDRGQDVVGQVTGSTVAELYTQCAQIAEIRYGDRGSFGVFEIELIEENLRSTDHVGICEVDDDSNFDRGQFVIGRIAAPHFSELYMSCKKAASAMHPDSNTFAVFEVNRGRSAPPHFATGECHIDDDPRFDRGQFVVGTLWSRSRAQLEIDCAEAARLSFGADGTSRVY